MFYLFCIFVFSQPLNLMRLHLVLGKWDVSHIIPCTSIDTNPPETFTHLPEELLSREGTSSDYKACENA
jgi:hypothetical protein